MAAKSKDDNEQYFRLQKMPWLIVSPAALAVLTAAALKPELIPVDHLGPLKSTVQNVLDNHHGIVTKAFALVLAVHSLEAAYATYIARKNNQNIGTSLAWGIQTFIYGMTSLIPLKRHFKRKNKKTT